MVHSVILNDREFKVTDFQLTTAASAKTGKALKKIAFQFKVEHREYHEVTTLLYQNDFKVKVPEEELAFEATITNYSTSVTDLYKENAVGNFTLELTEKE